MEKFSNCPIDLHGVSTVSNSRRSGRSACRERKEEELRGKGQLVVCQNSGDPTLAFFLATVLVSSK